MCFAKQYFGDHGLCGYALVQDLIWSEIQPYEDAGETGYYLADERCREYPISV
ncbi:MAG: hypothetical protein ACLU3F_00345 [Blautia wexlerae]